MSNERRTRDFWRMRQLKERMSLMIPAGASPSRVAVLTKSPLYRDLNRQLNTLNEQYGFKDQIERKGRKASTRKANVRIRLKQHRGAKRADRAAIRSDIQQELSD